MEVEQGDQQDGESYKTMMKMVIMICGRQSDDDEEDDDDEMEI